MKLNVNKLKMALSASSQQKSKTPIECPVYNTKQFDGEASVILDLWEMQSTLLLLLLSGPLLFGVLVPDRVLSIGQIELFGIQTVYLC